MFDQLNYRIKKSILLITTAFIVLISSLSMITLFIYLHNDFTKSKTDIINLSITSFDFDISLIKTNANALAHDSDIINYVVNGSNPQMAIDKISSISNYFDSVVGVTLYQTTSTKSVATSTISNYPSLSELKMISCINDYINNDSKFLIHSRTNYIADFYQSNHYDDSYGMISYFVKIDQNNQLYGLLVVDISPEYIYQEHFNYSEYKGFQGTITLITTSDNLDYLKHNGNLNRNTFLKYEPLDTLDFYNLNYYIYQTTILNNHRLITLIPSSNQIFNITLILLVFIIIDVILIFLSRILAKKLAIYVTTNLSKLNNKMENDKITHAK